MASISNEEILGGFIEEAQGNPDKEIEILLPATFGPYARIVNRSISGRIRVGSREFRGQMHGPTVERGRKSRRMHGRPVAPGKTHIEAVEDDGDEGRDVLRWTVTVDPEPEPKPKRGHRSKKAKG